MNKKMRLTFILSTYIHIMVATCYYGNHRKHNIPTINAFVIRHHSFKPSRSKQQYGCNSKLSHFYSTQRARHSTLKLVNDDDDDINKGSRNTFDQILNDFLLETTTKGTVSQGGNTTSRGDFPSLLPRNPFKAKSLTTPDKSKLYSDEELKCLLDIHQDITMNYDDDDDASVDGNTINDMKPLDLSSTSSFPLHDLVLQQMDEISNHDDQTKLTPTENVLPDLISKSKSIRAIASDIDGTLLSSNQSLHPKTYSLLLKAIQTHSSFITTTNNANTNTSHENKPFYFFPATGKSRAGAYSSLGLEISTLFEKNSIPGVFLQGLIVYDMDNTVIYEEKLSKEAIKAAETLIMTENLQTSSTATITSIVGYDGDVLYTTKQTDIVIHLHEHYGEPLPILIPSTTTESPTTSTFNNNQKVGEPLHTHKNAMHKLLIMDDDTQKLKHIIRPKLEEIAIQYGACVTQAIPTMLELLPQGCSKAKGVQKLCEHLNIKFENELLALGDAENDAEMLNMACIGVAMGNGCEKAKNAADYVMDQSNNDGGAGYAMELFGFNYHKERK